MQSTTSSSSPLSSALARKNIAHNIVNCPFSKPLTSHNDDIDDNDNDVNEKEDVKNDYYNAAEDVSVSASPSSAIRARTDSLAQRT